MSRISDFFGIGSATPTPAVASTASPTPAPVASPVAVQTAAPPARKTARQARPAESAAKTGADSKQPAATETRTEPTSADVSLEPSPEATEGDSRAAGATPGPSAAESGAKLASVPRNAPMLSSAPLETSGPPAEANPAKAAKLVQDIDKVEKRVDRKSLNADDSQRDILAQRLLQEAKKALAEHDNVAAASLATKASTLLEPLPKLADSAIPSTP
jgi:hypothetical protein